MEILGKGAEAEIYKEGNKIIKDRISKGYRLKELDEKIRKLRTKSEKKLLDKASEIVNVPKILNQEKFKLELEFIEGLKLSEYLDKLETKNEVCFKIGKELSKLHEKEIIHGDLTTSNLILKDKKIYFIDFGLGFVSSKIEDMAVDIHLFRQALESKHYKIYLECYESFLKGYRTFSKYLEVIKRLDKVEKRGRYKDRL
ncbi:Kae1-associated serine/threonine protein kinase [Candidatus Woesearchaeota archaeon]|nr:Kae1-associated serine/threonine protein kinase [Candidatus Woesearchaeota archaeon]